MKTKKLEIEAHHVYKINLITIYERIKAYYDTYKNKQEGRKALLNLEESIQIYCENNDVDFNLFETRSPIIVDSSKNEYQVFLAISLAFYDINLIPRFLNYQRDNFKGNDRIAANNFLGFIEFLVYKNVKKRSQVDTPRRLKQIIQWVQTNENETNRSAPIPTLEWINNSLNLHDLSKELKAKGFTEKTTSFEKVFTENLQINWLKEPEFLVYLIYKLYKSKNKCFKAVNGGKGYFKVSALYFTDYSQQFSRQIDFNHLLDEVKNKQAERYAITRERVEKLISNPLN